MKFPTLSPAQRASLETHQAHDAHLLTDCAWLARDLQREPEIRKRLALRTARLGKPSPCTLHPSTQGQP